MLVWVAFSEDGIAEPFIQESSIAIDAERNINKCLKPKLFKFIRSWYNHDEYVFWPDLASAHYGKTTIETLKVKKIVFVSRGDNPPVFHKPVQLKNFEPMSVQKCTNMDGKQK